MDSPVASLSAEEEEKEEEEMALLSSESLAFWGSPNADAREKPPGDAPNSGVTICGWRTVEEKLKVEGVVGWAGGAVVVVLVPVAQGAAGWEKVNCSAAEEEVEDTGG